MVRFSMESRRAYQSVDLAEDGVELRLRVRAQRVADVLAVRTEPDAGHDPVGGGALTAQDGQGVGGPGVIVRPRRKTPSCSRAAF